MSFDDSATYIIDQARPNARFIVKKGPQAGLIFPLMTDRIIIGREDVCEVVLQDAEVSRRHLEITWEETGFQIQDLGSTNGSFLNGFQLTTLKMLKNGDVVGLGQTSLRFELDSIGLREEARSPAVISGTFSRVDQDLFKNKMVLGLSLGCGTAMVLCMCAVLGFLILDLWQVINLL